MYYFMHSVKYLSCVEDFFFSGYPYYSVLKYSGLYSIYKNKT